MANKISIVTRRILSLAFGALVVTLCVLGFAGPAQAHNYLVSSTPGIGTTISELPKQFEVTTNDNLLNLAGNGNGFFIEVKGPDGLYYGDGCVTVAGPSILMNAALGPAGKYSLAWQAVSADGHTVSSDFAFTWNPAADAQLSSGSKSVPNCHGTVSGIAADPGQSPDASTIDSGTLSDVLWIGGTIGLAGIAAVATILVLSRKRSSRNSK
jgi:methionine-rich copper-binding protein CopC